MAGSHDICQGKKTSPRPFSSAEDSEIPSSRFYNHHTSAFLYHFRSPSSAKGTIDTHISSLRLDLLPQSRAASPFSAPLSERLSTVFRPPPRLALKRSPLLSTTTLAGLPPSRKS